MLRKMFCILFVVGMLITVVVPKSYGGKVDDTLNVSFRAEIDTLDNYFSQSREGFILWRCFCDTLLYRDPKTFEYKPLLATSYKIVDNVTLEFELREGVKFHNGEEFDADDVVYTFNWMSNPDNKALTRNTVDWIKRAEKLGKYRVRVIAKTPFPMALEWISMALMIYPKDYYSKVGPTGWGLKPVGTGPYKVTEVQVGQKVVLVKNDGYFDGSPKGKPNIGKIVVRTQPDTSTQMAELLAGRADWSYDIAGDQAEQLAGRPNISVKNEETMRVGFLSFNITDKSLPVNKLKVRQAIAHAINRQQIANALFKGKSRVINSACYPTQFGCTDDVAKYEYNPEKSKKLLAEAGYPNGFKMDFYPVAPWGRGLIAEAVASDLKAVGIECDLHIVQFALMKDNISKWPLYYSTWGSWSINDASAILAPHFEGTYYDICKDPEVIKWLTTFDSTMDPNVRKENSKKALQRIAEQVYWLPMFTYSRFYVGNKDLDFMPTVDEIPRFFLCKWK